VLFYAVLLNSFACGVWGLYDELLFVYFVIFLVQSIDGVFIKVRKDLDSEPILTSLFDPEPEKTEPDQVSKQSANSSSSQEPPQVRPTSQHDNESDFILSILENMGAPCKFDLVYKPWHERFGRWRKRSDPEELLKQRLEMLSCDKKIDMQGEGEDTLYSIHREEKVMNTKSN